ncbi:MAG: hypothetical protein VX633_05485, partial [Verrucomicrobiota bacterium]|nr:hypothetical protein [Verrucomicrobiota bacterium]
VSRGSNLGYNLPNHRWRYARWPDGEELYNLRNDPTEKRNLATNVQLADRLEEFRGLLAQKKQNAGAAR